MHTQKQVNTHTHRAYIIYFFYRKFLRHINLFWEEKSKIWIYICTLIVRYNCNLLKLQNTARQNDYLLRLNVLKTMFSQSKPFTVTQQLHHDCWLLLVLLWKVSAHFWSFLWRKLMVNTWSVLCEDYDSKRLLFSMPSIKSYKMSTPVLHQN